MNQEIELQPETIAKLYHAMVMNNRPVTIDWVNRTIRILSDVRVNPNVVLSTGPMTYQDILFQL